MGWSVSWKGFKRAFWLTFSEADERYVDLFRVGYALGVFTFLGLALWAGFRAEAWDPVAFGTGFGAVLLLGGAGVGLRGKLEDGTPAQKPIDDVEE